MPIDFHHDRNEGTYASRTANNRWGHAMRAIVDPRDKVVADIGCGGGIYSRAWSNIGARSVIGIDFSARMVDDAQAASADDPALEFRQGDATATGLPDASVDIIFERALVHHLSDLDAVFNEATRILRPNGLLIVQDRTMDDVQAPASPQHLRGYFFEAYPRLLDTERARRPEREAVESAMRRSGFANVTVTTLAEPRRTYESPDELGSDLRARTGRSILHELDDDELSLLIDVILDRTRGSFPLEEVDSWTVWSGRAPFCQGFNSTDSTGNRTLGTATTLHHHTTPPCRSTATCQTHHKPLPRRPSDRTPAATSAASAASSRRKR